MIIDCIADLHGLLPELPGGDLLIIAGDLTASDEIPQYRKFHQWVMQQKYKKVVIIGGNHDNKLQNQQFNFNEISGGPTYLFDESTEFEGLKIYGSPWSLYFQGMNPKCAAFTKRTEDEIRDYWERIPTDTNILVTHTPPHGILDKNSQGYSCGSSSLRNTVLNGTKFPRLRLHVFGHIHERGGLQLDLCSAKFVNCSLMGPTYEPENEPVRIFT